MSKVLIETPRLVNDEKILSENKNLILEFIDGLKRFNRLEGSNFKNLWRGVPKNHGRRPLLAIFIIRPKIEDASKLPEVLFALGFGFPALDPSVSESQIKTADFVINAVGSKFEYEEGIEE